MPPWLLLVAAVGSVAALTGGYWDDAWHTERGRDAFFIAPHLAIYIGVAAVGGALGLHVLMAARRVGVRGVARDRALVLAVVSVSATLASGPIDNAWHIAFGRDAVFWSPPHMLGIVGTLALGAALLTAAGHRPIVGALIGGLVLAAATFPVAEYETDVPQFDVVWYLPALSLGAAIGLGLVGLAAGDRAWSRGKAAAIQFGLLLGVWELLRVLGFDGPALPLLVVPALVADLVRGRGWRPLPRAAAFTGALYAVYVPVRNDIGAGVQIGPEDILAGLPLAVLAVWVVERLVDSGGRPAPHRALLTGALCMALSLLSVGAAGAHDPGQGEDAGFAQLAVESVGATVALEGRLLGEDCNQVTRGKMAARRAGTTLRSPLRVKGCAFAGELEVKEAGRWFVYAELLVGERRVEAWLPIRVDATRQRASSDRRFVYEPPIQGSGASKYVAGALLYLAMCALLLAALRLAARHPPRRTSAGPRVGVQAPD